MNSVRNGAPGQTLLRSVVSPTAWAEHGGGWVLVHCQVWRCSSQGSRRVCESGCVFPRRGVPPGFVYKRGGWVFWL